MNGTALDVARDAGLRVVMRGQRGWTNCPAHEDKHPSLCLYPDDGGWFCFSCHTGGDARALYRLIHGCAMPGAVPPARRRNPARELYVRLDAKARRINAAAAELRVAAQLTLDDITANAPSSDAVWSNPIFCLALSERSRADCTLNSLDTADASDLLTMED